MAGNLPDKNTSKSDSRSGRRASTSEDMLTSDKDLGEHTSASRCSEQVQQHRDRRRMIARK